MITLNPLLPEFFFPLFFGTEPKIYRLFLQPIHSCDLHRKFIWWSLLLSWNEIETRRAPQGTVDSKGIRFCGWRPRLPWTSFRQQNMRTGQPWCNSDYWVTSGFFLHERPYRFQHQKVTTLRACIISFSQYP